MDLDEINHLQKKKKDEKKKDETQDNKTAYSKENFWYAKYAFERSEFG